MKCIFISGMAIHTEYVYCVLNLVDTTKFFSEKFTPIFMPTNVV